MNQDAGNAYADLIAESQDRKVYLLFPRIPGNQKYIHALDDAIRRCLKNQSNAQTELDAVAEQWEEITDSLGRDKQKRALRFNDGI